MRKSLIDTDTLSYVINRRYPEVESTAAQYLRIFRNFSVSAVTISEIVEGLESQANYFGTSEFLELAEGFEIIPIETEEAVIAGRILGALTRADTKIGEMDPFIAATAIQYELPLVTNNTRHYQRIVDLGFPLELDNWRSL